jgi:hypothetical protein
VFGTHLHAFLIAAQEKYKKGLALSIHLAHPIPKPHARTKGAPFRLAAHDASKATISDLS